MQRVIFLPQRVGLGSKVVRVDLRALVCCFLVLAAPTRAQDAGRPGLVLDVATGLVTTPDAGVRLVGSGCYLSDDACLATARRIVALQAENDTLRTSPPPTHVQLVVAVAFGLVAGAAVGGVTAWSLARAIK